MGVDIAHVDDQAEAGALRPGYDEEERGEESASVRLPVVIGESAEIQHELELTNDSGSFRVI